MPDQINPTDTDPTEGGSQGDATPAASETPATWEAALAALPEGVRALYDSHITGLKNTVTTTRQERDALNARIKDITKALGKDNPEEAKTLVEQMASELEQAERRASFYEDAGRPEIGCTNPKLAFLAAEAGGLFDKKGNANWEQIKAAAPELFRKIGAGSADGGAGSTSKKTPAVGMNDFIRAAAGR